MAHTELDLRERRAIEDMLNAKVPVSKIAAEIGRHRSTVHREIKRNRYYDDELPELNGYYALNAQNMYEKRRAVYRKMIVPPELKAAIEDRLKVGWSPEHIAGRLQHHGESLRISQETIYAHAYGPDGQSEESARYLSHRRKKRQPLRRRTLRCLVFRQNGQFMSGPATSKPERHSANRKAI